MDQRKQFITAWLRSEETRSLLCRQFGISRKTGYKWVARFHEGGVAALNDRSHAPHHQPRAVAEHVEHAILRLRGRHPYWGPRKLRAWLQHRHAGSWPATSTIGALLQRHGLTVPRRRRHHAVSSSPCTSAGAANAVWAADFKGSFLAGNGHRCNPLTISDVYSRYLLRCHLVLPHYEAVRPLFEATFREYGLPQIIRTDNGAPFASVGAGGLSRLSVWWIRLGIRPERIDAGHPEQNGEHERMHRTLKQETARPPQRSRRAQQEAFDRFRQVYNEERPHEALDQRPPATRYAASARPYPERVPPLSYPETYIVRRAHPSGEIKWRGGRVRISQALAGEPVGVEEIGDGVWRVWFGPVELGYLDARRPARLHRPAVNHNVLPISPV
jgi:transposase InsO family protein